MRIKKIAAATMWLPGMDPESSEQADTLPPVPQGVVGTVQPPPLDLAKYVENHPCEEAAQQKQKPVWPILGHDFLGEMTPVSRFHSNMEAINLLASIAGRESPPTEDEHRILSRYTGWGAIPEVFDERKNPEGSAWAQRRNTLREALGEEGYSSAAESVNNAHFTEPEIVSLVWDTVKGLGFKGGNVIETSAGAGYFLSWMPRDIASVSDVTAVEVDATSARLLKAMYQPYGVNVVHSGLEHANLEEGSFDLAISNVPFGKFGVADKSGKHYSGWSIHNWFFGKALDLVRPGGLVAFITSSYTLEGDKEIRRYISGKADFIGAIRLPAGTFSRVASTEVVTDVIFLRRNDAPDAEANDKAQFTDILGIAVGESHAVVNGWFAGHRDMMCGELSWQRGMYHSGFVLMPEAPGTLDSIVERAKVAAQSIVARADTLGMTFQPAKKRVKKAPRQTSAVAVSSDDKIGAYVLLDDGRIAKVKEAGLAEPVEDLGDKKSARIRGMIEIRKAVRALLKAQLETESDDLLKVYQVALAGIYDAFVAQHGPIHARANVIAFRRDPDMPLLLSLELWDEETQTAKKADVFHRRTIKRRSVPSRCESPVDALRVSIQEFGQPVPAFMADLVGKSAEDVTRELSEASLIFMDPEEEAWQAADEYLSGDIRHKLKKAKAAGLKENADALQKVLPPDLTAGEIDARLGASWIPESDYLAFIRHIAQDEDGSLVKGVRYSKASATWSIDLDHWARKSPSVAVKQRWGTERANAFDLFEQSMNQQVPTVRDEVRDGDTVRYVVNKTETIAAREKQHELREAFRAWVFSDAERAERLCRKYNEEYNSWRLREYDGSHLVLPGYSGWVDLHGHQKDAIWRVSTGNNTLLAHVVGAGKTLEAVCGSMELRRLGIATKPLHVVPNHMLEQYTAEFLRAYPTANVLMAGKDDLEGERRRELMGKIATGDWDAVIITHASFERFKLSKERTTRMIKHYINLITAELQLTTEVKKGRNPSVKQLQLMRKRWLVRLDKLNNEDKRDDVLDFESLGVDYLFIDEAHLFKNLFRISKMGNVSGLPTAASERAFDLYTKTQYLAELHGRESGVVFMTGTPISNTMAEMHVMMRYMIPDLLERKGIAHFDAWAAHFGESVTALEIAPDGSGYRMHTRFSRFVNIPELMNIFKVFADIKTREMLNLPTPKVHRETISVKPSPELLEYVESLIERADLIRSGQVDPKEDNMLSVTNDGRKAALDMRLVDRLMEVSQPGKVDACIDKAFAIWESTKETRRTQLIFGDLSTPNADGKFSVYAYIRKALVDRGVPAGEIAFIHDYDSDAAKAKLFESVREGRVRILLGSTSKMGVGTNVQKRLIAKHDLDAPWRPSDVEQRDGRIERQGNENEEVWCYRYVTERSFDAYMWQTLETKATFIAQVMRGDSLARSIEDVSLAALTYAEVKAIASGNPLVMQKAGVDAEVAKLTVMKKKWLDAKYDNQMALVRIPRDIAREEQLIEKVREDIAMVEAREDRKFAIELNGATYTERGDAAAKLELVHRNAQKSEVKIRQEIGSFRGFRIEVEAGYFGIDYLLVGAHEMAIGYSPKGDMSGSGLITRFANAIEGMHEDFDSRIRNLGRLRKTLAEVEDAVNKPFEHEERLETLLKEQARIDSELDLDKNQAGAAEAEQEATA